MRNNPQQGGGIFARYAGANMSPIPPGYMESAAQEANIYANMGANIANMMMKHSEMEMKGKELETTNETNRVKAKTEENKTLEIFLRDEREREKLGADVQSNQIKTVMDADKLYAERIDEARDSLSPDSPNYIKDPAQRALIEQKIRGWQASRGGLLDTIDRYMKISPNSSGQTSPVSKELREQYKTWQAIPQGIRSPSFNPQVTPPRVNPTEAPAATKGADGGLDGAALRAAGIPVATKAIFGNRVLGAAPAPAAEPQQRTVDGKPSTVTENKPDLARGDLGFFYNINQKIINSDNQPVVGQIKATKKDDGTFDYGLEFNDSQITPSVIDDPQVLQSNQQIYRNLHAIRFILESGLNEGIDPNKDEVNVANKVYNANQSAVPFKIQQAVALLLRDQQPGVPGDAYTLEFNRAFRRKFGTTPDMYLVAGEQKPQDIELTPSQIPRLQAAQEDIQKRIATAAQQPMKKPQDVGIDPLDPTQANRITLLAQMESLDRRIAGVSPDTSVGKRLIKQREILQKRYDIYKSESELWAKQLERFREEQKQGETEFKQAEEVREQIASTIGIQRWGAELEAKAKTRIDTMIGARPGDEKLFGGWMASGIVNWPGNLTVALPNGKVVKAGPQDIIETAKRTNSWGMVLDSTTDIKLPDYEKDLPALNTAHSEHQKLIPPLNRLMDVFRSIDTDSAMEAFGKKWYVADVAAREPDVFAIMAALRKPYTGGGNPSNFEQQMLLSAIPNPGTVFTLNNFSIHRMRTIALLSMLEHARNMQQHGLVITPAALASYNRDYKSILGREITMNDFKKYNSLVDSYSAGWRPGVGNWKDPNDYNNKVGDAAFQDMIQNVEADFPKFVGGRR